MSTPLGGQPAAWVEPRGVDASRDPTAKHDVFVSYNHKDVAQVSVLVDVLREQKITAWFDGVELVPGDDFRERIRTGMRACRGVVVVRGPHGVGRWQRDEVGLADDLHKDDPRFFVIPIILPGGKPEDFDRLVTYVEFRESFVEEDKLERLVAGIRGEAPAHEEHLLPDQPAPYRGLAAFGSEDRRFFFGRRAEIARMRERLGLHPFLAVIGASGSGKTSLVQAGFLGDLESAPPVGTPGVRSLSMRPGSDPLRSLAACLAPLQPLDPLRAADEVYQRLTTNPDDLPLLVQSLHPSNEWLVVVVDRLEELFTLCTEAERRSQFARALVATARSRAQRVWVVVTMRADFYGHLTRHADLAEEVEQHQILLSALADQDVHAIINEPLLLVGGIFERGLDHQVAEDAKVDGEVSLPLLEFTLDLLWRARHGKHLTWDAYRRIGRVAGALTGHADRVIEALNAAERETARRILLRLIWLGEGLGRITGRPAVRAELVEHATDPLASERVLHRLADERLIVVDSQGPVPLVTLAHDTLPLHWQQLERWVEEDREFLRWRERLRPQVQRFAETEDPDSLQRGGPLIEAEAWLAKRGDDLTTDERGFIARGVKQRTAQWLRRVSLRIAVGLALAGIVLAGWQSAVQWRRARASTLVTNALAQQAFDPELSLLLARESVALEPTGETHEALRHALLASHVRRRFAHARKVQSAAFSVDGQWVLTASWDGTAVVWNARTGERKATIPDQKAPVYSASFSPDGQHIVTASGATARLWSIDGIAEGALETQAAEAEAPSPNGQLYAAAFNGDGTAVITAGRDGTARVWDVHTRAPTGVVLRHDGPVQSVAFSQDGRRVVTASWDASARVWDPTTGRQLAALPHGGRVTSAAFGPDGRSVVTAGPDSIARVWDLDTQRVTLTLEGHARTVTAAAFSADGRLIGTASEDGTARIWSAATGREIVVLRGHATVVDGVVSRAGVSGVAFSPAADAVLTASADATARLWEVATDDGAQRLQGHTGEVRSALFSADGQRILTASEDGTAALWDPRTGAVVQRLSAGARLMHAVLNPDASVVVMAGDGATLLVADLRAGAVTALQGHRDHVRSAAFSTDGRFLITAGADGTARVWAAGTWTPAYELGGHRGGVNSAVFSPDGSWIVTAGDDGTARVWDAHTHDLVKSFEEHASPVFSAAFSVDGLHVATGSGDRRVRLWSTTTWRQEGELREHTDAVLSVAFGPTVADKMLLATAGMDRTARIWDAQSGAPVAVLTGSQAPLFGATFSSDRKFVVTASGDGSATIYRRERFAPFDELGRLAVERPTRALSAEERRQYGVPPGGWWRAIVSAIAG